MANKNFEIKNGLTVAGTERISSAGAFSGSLASSTTATTQAASDNTTKLASTAYVTTALANLVDGAPSTLNTLNEIAAALNDDAALNTTLTTSIAAKLPLAGGTLTGALTIGSGGGLHLRPTDSSDTDAWILYQYTDDTLRYNFTGAGADEIIIKHPGSTNATTLTIDTANKSLGIGTTSPGTALQIGDGTGSPYITIDKSATGASGILLKNAGNNKIKLLANASEEFELHVNNALAMYVKENGNVGIGTTPSTHYTGYEALDIGDTLSLMSNNTSTNISTLTNNGYLNSNASNWVRKVADESTMYEQVSGQHRFKSSASGSAGGAITWSEKMRIDASGNVGIGITPMTALHVQSNGAPDTSGNMTSGIVVSDSVGGPAIKLSCNNSAGYNYIQSSYVNNANVGRDLAIWRGALEKARVTSTGLQVTSEGGTRLKVENTDTNWAALDLTSGGNQANYIFFKDNSAERARVTVYDSNDISFSTGSSPSEKFRIVSGGDVCIGHTASVGTTHKGKLQVKSAISILDGSNTTAATLSLYSSGANSAFLSVDPDQQGANTMFYFYIDGSNKMFLNSAGRLFIDPLETRIGSGALNILGEVGNSYDAIQFRHNASTVVGRVRTTASSTSYSTSSDYRLKENIDYTWDATTRLKELKPARFNFIADPDTIVDGFLAHEVSGLVPEAITGSKDKVDSDGNPEYQGIDHSKLVPLLVKTIQELEARIATLEG